MTPGQVIVLVVVGGVLLVVLSLVVMYNRFVRQRTLIDESWGQIDVELHPSARADPQPGLDRAGVRRARGRRAREPDPRP